MPRSVFLPPNVPKDAQTFWTDLLNRIYETPEFKEYLRRTSQTGVFLTPAEMASLVKQEEEAARKLYAEEGWLVN